MQTYETTIETISGHFITRALTEKDVKAVIARMNTPGNKLGLIAISSACGLESGKFDWALAKKHEDQEKGF